MRIVRVCGWMIVAVVLIQLRLLVPNVGTSDGRDEYSQSSINIMVACSETSRVPPVLTPPPPICLYVLLHLAEHEMKI